jgi:hypothetical protein
MRTPTAARPYPVPPVPKRLERPRGMTPLAFCVGATVVLTPLLMPPGPGNTSIADAFMAASVLLAAVALAATRGVIRLPYAGGMGLMVIGGLIGALSSNAPVHVVLVVVQDVVLVLWAATLALGRKDPTLIEVATRAWCRSAPVLATVGVIAYLVGFAPLSGVTAADASRASYTFGDPNLAGNYLVLSLLMMYACRRPVRRRVRYASYVIVLVALVMTGSNGGMLSLALALSGCVILNALRRQGATAALATLSLCGVLTIGASVFVGPHIDLTGIRIAAAQSVPLVRDSVGRSDGSAGEREQLFQEGTRLWFSGQGTGFGPARTKATLLAFQAPYVKEAHNDYLATLLERGPVGVIGLVLLAAATVRNLRQLWRTPLSGRWHDAVPRAWALVVTAPVVAFAGAFYEVLHFRHLWTWLGLVAALAMVREQARFALPEERS